MVSFLSLIILNLFFIVPCAIGNTNNSLYYEANQNVNSNIGGGPTRNGSFGLALDIQKKGRQVEGQLDADVRYIEKHESTIFSVSELFVGYNGETYSLFAGRKILNWNPVEEFWLLNDLSGQRGFGLLDSKREGIFGTGLDKKWGGIEFSFFVSKIHLPPINPGYIFSNGKISSNQDWVSLPFSHSNYGDQRLPISYRLNRPETSEVIDKNSLGIRTGYNWGRGGFSGFAIYKPENVWRQHIVGNLSEDVSTVEVEITPIVNYHVIYGLDIRQKISKIDVQIGYKIIDPNGDFKEKFPVIGNNLETVHPSYDSEYFQITPKYRQKRYFHAQTGYEGRSVDFNLFALQSQGDQQSGDSFSGDVVKWKRAVGFLFNYKLTDKFNMLLDIKYDIKMEDNTLKNEINYKPFKHFSLAMGMELLRAKRDDSYWSAFRSNDLVYSKVAFVF